MMMPSTGRAIAFLSCFRTRRLQGGSMLAHRVTARLVLAFALSSCAKVSTSLPEDAGGDQDAARVTPDAAADRRSPDIVVRHPDAGGCDGVSSPTGGCNLCGNGTLN